MKMFSTAVLLIAFPLLLAGCDPTPEETRAFQSRLPAGCVGSDAGSLGAVGHVVVVRCDGRRVNSTSYEIRHGKWHSNYATVVVEEREQ